MKVKMLKLLSPLFVLALALSLMAAVVLPQTASASPADWYVSTMGSDTTGDGSSGNPWRTIQHAVYSAGVSNGDTIIVHAGTYTENVNVDKELTIQAAPGENVTVQAANSDDHVFEVTADNVTITGFTVTGATGLDEAGIYLGWGVEHCTITNNTAESNYSGIRLDSSNNNTISGNTVSGNEGCGIWLSWEDSGNTISGNTASANDNGICLYRASNNTISDNTASGNYYGIYLLESNGNTVGNNTASDNEDMGIVLSDSSDNTIEDNTANENDRGIYLYYSSDNNTLSGNTASGNDYGIYLYQSSGNTLSGNTASDNDYGVYLYYSSGNTISGNIANENDNIGIYLEGPNNNTVSGNTATDNDYGVYLYYSSNNTISSNTASGNEWTGILLSHSSNNTISGNTANGNNEEGITLSHSSDNNTVSGNTASDNEHYGIYLYQSSGNTIEGNTANNNNAYGIYVHYSSGNTIEGNTANNNQNIGIYIHYSSGNTISDNIAGNMNGTRQDDGIHLVGSGSNIIDNNTLTNNTLRGIYLFDSDNNIFLNNTVHDNGHGIHIEDSSGNWFVGNDIRGNYAEDSGVHLNIIWATVADNHIMFNNIVDNTDGGSYGVYNEAADIVNATLNWWGDASGPSGDGPGTGDAVSGNVTFEPWLSVSVAGGMAEAITGAQEGVVISGPTGSDTTLTVNTSDDVTVIVALYSGNPEEPLPDKALGKYIDIYASDPDAIVWPVYVEMSYTEDEVAAAGIDESTLGLYYWDPSANEFHRCSDTGVDTATNIIWANVAEDEAGGLAGTPFAPGGSAAPGGLSIGVIVGIVIGVCVVAGLIAYFLIRRRRAAGKRA